MAQMFKTGDRVHHVGRREDGTVLPDITIDVVRVQFDNPTPRGDPSIGQFDELWFDMHPGWLKLILAQKPAAPLPTRHYKSSFVPT